jgi:protein kinase A
MSTETENTSLREIYKRKKGEFYHKIQSTPKSIPNASLDDYIISHTLGTGTFASVVLAKPKNEIDKNYAIKIMRKHRLIECNQVENVINEKKLLFALDYPFLVKIEKCFKDNSNVYIVLEYVEGGEMFTHLRKKV